MADPYYPDPPTITEWLNFIGWTAYPLIIIAVLLTVWSVRIFLRTPSGNQTAAFTMAAILPAFIGLLGFAAGWRAIVDVTMTLVEAGDGRYYDYWYVLGGSQNIMLSLIIGMVESIIFLSVSVIILLRNSTCSS